MGEIAKDFPVSRPAIYQHFRTLKHARLVKDQVSETRRVYQLDHRGFDSLRAYFDWFWSTALDVFKQKVEEQ